MRWFLLACLGYGPTYYWVGLFRGLLQARRRRMMRRDHGTDSQLFTTICITLGVVVALWIALYCYIALVIASLR